MDALSRLEWVGNQINAFLGMELNLQYFTVEVRMILGVVGSLVLAGALFLRYKRLIPRRRMPDMTPSPRQTLSILWALFTSFGVFILAVSLFSMIGGAFPAYAYAWDFLAVFIGVVVSIVSYQILIRV